MKSVGKADYIKTLIAMLKKEKKFLEETNLTRMQCNLNIIIYIVINTNLIKSFSFVYPREFKREG